MSKKCTPLWREAGFQLKMVKTQKTPHVRTTFGRSDVEKVHAVGARSTFPSQKCLKEQVHTNLTNLTNLTYLTNLTNLLTN